MQNIYIWCKARCPAPQSGSLYNLLLWILDWISWMPAPVSCSICIFTSALRRAQIIYICYSTTYYCLTKPQYLWNLLSNRINWSSFMLCGALMFSAHSSTLAYLFLFSFLWVFCWVELFQVFIWNFGLAHLTLYTVSHFCLRFS